MPSPDLGRAYEERVYAGVLGKIIGAAGTEGVAVNAPIAVILEEGEDASAIEELQLVQERRDLAAELESMGTATDLTDLEDSFVEVAKAYGDRKGIEYATWREFGVSAATLRDAGINRGG